ncbi:MAG: ammonium transporter [Prolixibacteraceae bacterium]|jgi:Amt family ammonium transporter|nr:ammonium transporter [Prolixibacteraceae bacterium]
MDETLTLDTLSKTAEGIAMSLDTVWVLIAAALVFFMQAGFALVEAGFTRQKNTVNIMAKNLIDFALGSLLFWVIGFSIMFGSDIAGFIGMPELFSTDWEGAIPAEAFLIFQTVFAATAATIVSGAMAERTEFKAYFFYSIAITAIIYPVSGHWVWGGGWLSQMETAFHDFAGSSVVHMVGGMVAFTGAMLLGPRLGKYNSSKKSNAIPGHNIAYGALGVFILWLGWFGFNPGSQLAASGPGNATAISHIFVTTNLAAAGGTVAALVVSWLRYGKPSLSFALNGALAGLVAITAGCDLVSASSAVIIGLIAGIVLVYAVTFIDHVLHVDDPVGAISVHGVCGALGTILTGVFAAEGGILFGGGSSLLISQIIGVVTIAAWSFSLGFILFKVLKATVGLRVPKRIEEEGLDIYEHGESAYN